MRMMHLLGTLTAVSLGYHLHLGHFNHYSFALLLCSRMKHIEGKSAPFPTSIPCCACLPCGAAFVIVTEHGRLPGAQEALGKLQNVRFNCSCVLIVKGHVGIPGHHTPGTRCSSATLCWVLPGLAELQESEIAIELCQGYPPGQSAA